MTAREKELTGLLEQCQQALVESRRENEFLRQKIDLLIKRVFGSSSEQLDRSQLELLLMGDHLKICADIQISTVISFISSNKIVWYKGQACAELNI